MYIKSKNWFIFSVLVFRIKRTEQETESNCLGNNVLYKFASVISYRLKAKDTQALFKKFNRFLISVIALMTLFNMSLSQSLSHEDLFRTPRRRSGIIIVSSRRRIVAFLTALRTNGEKFLRREITRAYVYAYKSKQCLLQRWLVMSFSYQGGVLRSDVRNQECFPMVEFGLLGFLQSQKT